MSAPRWTVVYVSDDMQPSVYGTYTSYDRARAARDRMDRDLENDRDMAGGGAGHVQVCRIQPARAWDE